MTTRVVKCGSDSFTVTEQSGVAVPEPDFGHAYVVLDDEVSITCFSSHDPHRLCDVVHNLESCGGRIVDCLRETPGHLLLNPWNSHFVSGFPCSTLSSKLAYKGNMVGVGSDRVGRLIASAAFCGLLAFRPPFTRRSMESLYQKSYERVCFLSHTVDDLQHAWVTGFKLSDEEIASYSLGTDYEAFFFTERFSSIVFAHGEFWDTTHSEIRSQFALIARNLKRAGVKVGAIESVISKVTRKAADLVLDSFYDFSKVAEDFSELLALYKSDLFVKDKLILLPTTPMPAPLATNWPLTVTDRTANPLEYLMPSLLSDFASISVPCGFTVDGLPIGLQVLCSPEMTGKGFLFAKWFLQQNRFRTIASVTDKDN